MVIDIVDLRQPTECSSERSALLAGLRSGGGDTFMPGVKMQKSLVLIIPMICASVKRLFRIRLLRQKVEQTLN